VTTEKKDCCKRVWHSGSMHGSLCLKPAKFEHEGQPYCSNHYPPNVEARNKKATEKWVADLDHRRRIREESYAAQCELDRKAARHDVMEAFLKRLIDDGDMTRQVAATVRAEARKILEGK
jgi:hypothetical protein